MYRLRFKTESIFFLRYITFLYSVWYTYYIHIRGAVGIWVL